MGRKLQEGNLISALSGKPNGEKCPVTNLKNGNGIMVFSNEDETEDYHVTCKDGEYVED